MGRTLYRLKFQQDEMISSAFTPHNSAFINCDNSSEANAFDAFGL